MKTLVESVAQAQEVYYLANGEYATNLEYLDVQFPPRTVEFQLKPGENEEQGEARKKRSRTYAWGNCWINATVSACQNTQIGMQYRKYHTHSFNRRDCIIKTTDKTDWRNQICQAETGKSAAQGSTDNTYGLTSYIYP